MRDCGNRLAMRVYVADGHKEIENANFCRARMCPMCQWRDAVKRYGKVVAAISTIKGGKYLHVVLTIKNVYEAKDLGSAIDKLLKSEGQLAQNLQRGLNGAPKILLGRMRSLEITTNEDGAYHPHLHVLWHVSDSYGSTHDNYIHYKKLSSMWGEIIGQKQPYVWIRQVRTWRGRSVAGAVAEVTKYAVKPKHITSSEVYKAIYYGTYGRRIWSTSGTLKKAIARIKETDVRDIGIEGIDYIIEYYRWMGEKKIYQKI